MLDNIIVVDKANIIEEAKKAKKEGYRLAAVTCENEGDTYEMLYHFDLNHEMKNVKVMLQDGDKQMDSISPVYSSAFLIENEFQDLYGMVFKGLTIDYKGRLYMTERSPKDPMVRK